MGLTMQRARTLAALIAALFPLAALLAQSASGSAPTTSSAPADELAALLEQLGADEYAVREQATRLLLRRGPAIAEWAARQAELSDDPEIRRRLLFVLDNLAVPSQAVIVVRAAEDADLHPGELITHVHARRVAGVSELRQALAAAPMGAAVRVLGVDGPREVGPLTNFEVISLLDYVAPRGATIAEAVRLFAEGYAERADELLRTRPGNVPEAELGPSLAGVIACTAGRTADALEMLRSTAGRARPPQGSGSAWSSPSYLDLIAPTKAPYHLEYQLLSLGTPPMYDDRGDPDLRVQRVLVPARRSIDALQRAASLWRELYRERLGMSEEVDRVAGNQLAVCGWMLSELGLLSECCRLIEPRSRILRQALYGSRKWLRVETDAWLPLLAGDAPAALEMFYDDALDVLRMPPGPRDSDVLVRNPQVAARVGLFLALAGDTERAEEALEAVRQYGHPYLREYAWWLIFGLNERCEALVRKQLQALLPVCADRDAAWLGQAVARLEYVQTKPDRAILLAAQQRISAAPHSAEHTAALSEIEMLNALLNDRQPATGPDPATDASAGWPAALAATARIRAALPESSEHHETLNAALLVVPLGTAGQRFAVLTRDRRLVQFDVTSGALSRLADAPNDWFPGPLNWPWLGHEPSSGRVWLYDRRRVLELGPGAQAARLNVAATDIAAFDRLMGPRFSLLAEALAAGDFPAGENSEFLRGDIRANAAYVADPDLPELAWVRAVGSDGPFVHVALRGGSHLLMDTAGQRCWSSRWFAEALALPAGPRFFVHTSTSSAPTGGSLLLCSDQGLIRFWAQEQRAERLALPGDAPHAAVIPEDAPYARRDPRYAYVARLPADGGQVYRLSWSDGAIERVDLINEVLPEGYDRLFTRHELRAQVDQHLRSAGYADLAELVSDTTAVVDRWYEAHGSAP